MKDKIINLVSEVLENPVKENSTKDNTDNWDSLNHIKIVMELQDKFEIKIPAKDIDKLLSIKKIINYVKNRSE